MKPIIIEKILTKLNETGVKKKKLAEDMGISPVQLSQIFNGTHNIQEDELPAVFAFLEK